MTVETYKILRARDRMNNVLARYLEPSHAMERANNIAQALVFGAEDPAHIAYEMLDHLGLSNTPAVAAEVGRAWILGVRNADRGPHASSPE
jgi:hypothetical protein